MKVQEEFVIAESAQTLWEFFEQIERVARCVPGVEQVVIVDEDNSQLRVTQSLGPMTATFDVKMRITEREPGRSMMFTAVGRSVRGAAGNLRATHAVRLEEYAEGSTRVVLEGDLAMGGMLGSVGQKVVARQAAVVTETFAQALEQELSGGAEPTGGDASHAAPESSGTAPPLPGEAAVSPTLPAQRLAAHPSGSGRSHRRGFRLAFATALLLGGLLLLIRRRRVPF